MFKTMHTMQRDLCGKKKKKKKHATGTDCILVYCSTYLFNSKKLGQIWIIQSRAIIYQSFGKFLVCRPLRWHSATFCDVTTVQLSNGSDGTVHKFHKILLFMKRHLPSTIILRYGVLGLMLRLHYVPGGHGNHVSGHRGQYGMDVKQRGG